MKRAWYCARHLSPSAEERADFSASSLSRSASEVSLAFWVSRRLIWWLTCRGEEKMAFLIYEIVA